MFSPNAFIEYMSETASNYPPKGIINFAVEDWENLLDGKFYTSVTANGYTMRLLEPLFDDFKGEDSGLIMTATTGFALMKKVSVLTAEAVKEVRNDTYQVAQRFIARFAFDSRNEHPFFANVLNRFEMGNFKKDKQTFQNGADFYVGYLFTFQLRFDYIESVDDIVTETNWLDL